MESYWPYLTLVIMLIGTLGTLLPLLPGLPLLAAALLVYGWIEGFRQIDLSLVLITLLFTAIGVFLDYLAGPYVAKKLGATKAGVWGALLGGIGGILLLGPLGLLLGPFLGAALGEMILGKGLTQATRIGIGSVVGTLTGSILKFLLGLILTGIFFTKVFL